MTYKYTHSREGHFLFPSTVVKDKKHLILFKGKVLAIEVQKLLNEGKIPSPLESGQKYFEKISVHSDNQTPIYRLSDQEFLVSS